MSTRIEISIMIEQMKVLRDELLARDRLLRQAQAEIERLRSRPHRVPLLTFRDP